MKKRIVCLTLALILSMSQAVAVSASREEELREEQAWTNAQLDATYSRIDELWAAKSQLESEIATLDANLVDVMVSIEVLNNDISAKEIEIIKTKKKLGNAQNARDSQYENMKSRIKLLYEKGGKDAWFQMMMGAEDIADLLTRAEYTQKMYAQDRESLEKYAKTVEQVNSLREKYESEQAELEEMKAAQEEQSYILQCQLDEKRAISADCENEIAYAQQQATEYANLLVEQTAELERLEAERIAAEEEARRQAELERQAAEEAAAEAEESSEEASEESSETEYDEYGNVIDSDNTVSYDDYEAEQSYSDASSYSGTGSSVVDYATQFVGNPYVWGGTSLTNGADCSGFTQAVYNSFGVSIPRTSYEQQNAGREVSYSEAQPGDLICYGGHVAIYMGGGKIVHASNSRDGIKISNDATYRTILSVRRLV